MAFQRFPTRQPRQLGIMPPHRGSNQGVESVGRLRTLPLTPYGASVTRLDEGVFSDPRHSFTGGALPAPPATNYVIPPPVITPTPVIVQSSIKPQIHSMMINIILLAGIPQILLNGNANRVGVQIQNSDVANSFFYAIGVQASATFGFLLPAGATVLYDFVTPNDVIWGFTTAATLTVTLSDFSATYA